MSTNQNIDFDCPPERAGSHSLKWDRYKDVDIIPLWVADMDFQSPPAVLKALHERVDHGIFGYSLPPGFLVDAVCKMLADTYQWEIKPDWLVWLPGLVCGLNVACRSTGKNGDSVVSLVPVYPPFLTAPELSQRQLQAVPLIHRNERWHIDFDELEKAITPATAMFLLCNPHNPVGRMFDVAELNHLAKICLDNEVVICSDEIHCDLILDPARKHIPIATLGHEVAAKTITLMAPSKTYNIPGLGCSFAVIQDSSLRRQFKAAARGIVPEVNLLGFTAAEAAYAQSSRWLTKTLAYLKQNSNLVHEEINSLPGLSTDHVEATYLAWIDARGLELKNPAGFFENAGVGLSNGSDFGADGFLRLNFGCPRSRLEEALRRMRTAVLRRGSKQ